MTPETLLLRQIHPTFVQHGRVTSQAFRPTPKDESLLSVENGDKISSENAWRRFTCTPHCSSTGVMAVTYSECEKQELKIIEDGVPHEEHCSISFQNLNENSIKKK